MSLRKRIVLILIALAIVGAIGLSFRPMPVVVSVETVSSGALMETVEEQGKTRVAERYLITAPVAGYMPRLDLRAGDSVCANQPILALQPLPATPLDSRTRAETEARLAQARAALRAEQSRFEAARSANQLAARELQRLRPLAATGDISRSHLDQAQTEANSAAANLQAAQAAVDAAEQELRAAEALLAYYGDSEGGGEALPINSPISGRVLTVARQSQGTVQPGELLLTIGDPSTLEVEVDVLSVDAVRIQPGMRVLLQRWGGEEDLEAEVRTVEPGGFTKVSALGVEEQRVKIIVDFTSPREEWTGLGDGYRVGASFILWEGGDVLKAPTSALFRDDGGWAAFVLYDDSVQRRSVEVGHRSGLEAEILSGLEAGDQVITHPDETLAEGVRVEVRQ